MPVQCHFPSTNRIIPGTFHNLVHAVPGLWAAYLIADTSDADAHDRVLFGGADYSASVGSLIT